MQRILLEGHSECGLRDNNSQRNRIADMAASVLSDAIVTGLPKPSGPRIVG